MTLTLVTPPAVEPLSLAEAKLHLKVDDDVQEDDALIMALIASVRQYLDGDGGWLRRCLVNQTWRLDLPCFRDRVSLPLPPLQSVTGITYVDADGVTQTVDDAVYEVQRGGHWGGMICRRSGQSWPGDVTTDSALPVSVTFVAGFGPGWNDVPVSIRHGILMAVATYYEHREDYVVGGSMSSFPMGSKALWSPWRVPRVA